MSPDMLEGLAWRTDLAALPAEAAAPVYGGNEAFTLDGMAVRTRISV